MSDYDVRPVVSEVELRHVYPVLEDACRRIEEREGKHFFAPALYAALREKRQALFVVWDGPEEVGLFMAGAEQNDRNPFPFLVVTLAYVVPGQPADVMDAGLAKCREFAADLGCTRIRFNAVRRGWEKRAAELGYELIEYVYEREV